MGKWSEFTSLADCLRTCPQGEVNRKLGANLPYICNSIPATMRTCSLLQAWTGLSDVPWAKPHLPCTKSVHVGNEHAVGWCCPFCHFNVSPTCGVTGKSQRCPLGQDYWFHLVLGVERHFPVKSSWALSIHYDTVRKAFCLFWLKLVICQMKHQVLLFA